MLSLVSHVQYAPRALLTFEKRWDRRTDGHQTVTLRFLLDAASVITDSFIRTRQYSH